MKKCWNEDPLKRPDILDIKNIIINWHRSISKGISEKSRKNVLEFYKADKILKQQSDILYTSKSHSQAYHTSRLLGFTKQLNEILNQEEYETKCSGMFYFTFFYYLIFNILKIL